MGYKCIKITLANKYLENICIVTLSLDILYASFELASRFYTMEAFYL